MKRDKKSAFCRAIMVIFVSGFMCIPGFLHAETKYPTRAIEVYVPFAPGGGSDLQARVVCQFLSAKWRVPVNVVNKPGGNTIPAALEVLNSNPDGYTVFADSISSTSALAVTTKDLPFNILDRTFIAMQSSSGNVYFVNPALPVKNLKELEAFIKKDPGNFKWVSMGGAGGVDISIKKFFLEIGVDPMNTRPILAPGLAPAINLVAGGNAMMSSGSIGTVQSAISGGLIRGIGIGGKERWPGLPDVPTTEEQGYPNSGLIDWKGLSGPKKLSPEIVTIWNKALVDVLKEPEAISKLHNIGAVPFYHNSIEMRKYIENETDLFKKMFGMK